jgi:phage gpG-like protein
MTIIDKDRGWKRIEAEIAKARRGPNVQVGIFGPAAAADHGGQSNVQVAAVHEFGLTIDHPGRKDTKNAKPYKIEMPERSFLRGTVDAKAKQISTMQKRLQDRVIAGQMTTHQALETLGLYIKGLIQARIAAGIPPPLKPSTIRRKTVRGKAGTTPLIDTGQLRASIDHKVNNT